LSIRYRFRIVNSNTEKVAILLDFFGFRPPRFCGLSSAPFALFVGHGFQPTLAADPTAFGSHLSHNLLDYSKFYGFNGADGLHGDPASVLYGIKFFNVACALWHHYKRGTNREDRQAVRISNRPTTNSADAVNVHLSAKDRFAALECLRDKTRDMRLYVTAKSEQDPEYARYLPVGHRSSA
jgi:hypothetical protein